MRIENLKAIHQKKRDEKEAMKKKIKPPSSQKKPKEPKVEKEKAEPKSELTKSPKKKVQDPAPTKVSDSAFGSHAFLVEEFAKRWNYALPTYPPEGFDYSKDLIASKLHLVSLQDFNRLKAGQNEETKIDKKIPNGFQIVHSVEHYPGLFRSTTGEIFDLRPNTPTIIRPSLKTFNEMPKDRLKELLIKAY